MTNLIRYYESLNKILDAKERRKLERDYRNWLRDKFDWMNIHHHILTANNHGTGIKPNDLWCIPARDQDHHNRYHGIGQNTISLDKQLEFLEMLHSQFVADKGLEI